MNKIRGRFGKEVYQHQNILGNNNSYANLTVTRFLNPNWCESASLADGALTVNWVTRCLLTLSICSDEEYREKSLLCLTAMVFRTHKQTLVKF